MFDVDVARRFGDRKEFGVRFNGGHRGGRTAFDNQTDEFGNAVLNMDYRGERVRVSADVGYQSDDLSVPQRFRLDCVENTIVPRPPSAGSTSGMPSWSNWKPKDKFAIIQAVDVTDQVTAYAALGWHNSAIDFRYISPTVDERRTPGQWQAFPFLGSSTFDTRAGQAGIRASVDTGPINHALNVNYSEVDRPNDNDFSRAGHRHVQSLQSCRPASAHVHAAAAQPRPTRNCRVSVSRTRCRFSTSGYRSLSARADSR